MALEFSLICGYATLLDRISKTGLWGGPGVPDVCSCLWSVVGGAIMECSVKTYRSSRMTEDVLFMARPCGLNLFFCHQNYKDT